MLCIDYLELIRNLKGGDDMAPLQKRALWGLALGIVWSAATAVIFIKGGGIARFDADASFRLLMDGLFVGWLVVHASLTATFVSFRRSKKGKVAMDERDRAILERSPLIQLWAVILLLVAWVIGLSEVYYHERHVPIMFLYIIFFSVLVMSTVSQSLGILIGYWRMGRNG
jgi:hypothetical protein